VKCSNSHDDSDILVEDEHSEHDKQKEYLFNMKQLMPLLDRVGRLYCDISTYTNATIMNSKFSNLNEELFNQNIESNTELMPYTEEEKNNIKNGMLQGMSEREKRTINYQTPPNKFCKGFINPIPLCNTPLNVSRHQQPTIDLYIHSFASSPINIPTNVSAQNNASTNVQRNNNSSDEAENKDKKTQSKEQEEDHTTDKDESKYLGKKRKKGSDNDEDNNYPSNNNNSNTANKNEKDQNSSNNNNTNNDNKQ
jgi:hypothetical protein